MSEILETLTSYSQQLGDSPALIFGDEQVTWGDLVDLNFTDPSGSSSSPLLIIKKALLSLSQKNSSLEFHTSGSTGEPKEISLSYDSLSTAFQNAIHCFEIESGMKSVVAMSPKHIGGIAVATFPVLLKGGCVVFSDPRNPFSTVHAVAFQKPQILHMNPALLPKLRALESWKNLKLEFIKIAILGGSPVSQFVADSLYEQGVQQVASCYGLTECVPPVMVYRFEPRQKMPLPILGKSVSPTTEIRLNEKHELLILSQIQQNPNQWLNTGDVAQLIDGNYFFRGRTEGCGVINGTAIYSQDVEDLVNESGRGSAFIFDSEHKHGTLFLSPSDEDDHFTLVRQAYQKIKNKFGASSNHIHIRCQKLPLNPNGKVDRLSLRDQAQREWELLHHPKQEPSLIICKLVDTSSERFISFMDQCGKVGYQNNSNPEILHLDRMKETYGTFWTADDISSPNSTMVGISGCHDFTEYQSNTCRVLFRSCMLPHWIGSGTRGLSKYHFNSFPYAHMLPLQVHWGLQHGFDRFVITTNTEENEIDPSGKMFRSHKIMQHLEKLDIVHRTGNNVEIFYSRQDVWEVNIPLLNKIRIKLGYYPFF